MALTKVTNDLLTLDAAQPTITSTGTLTNFTSTGIDDNATSNAITIDASERVGIGVSSPATALDARGGVNSAHATFSGQAGRGLLLETEATTNNDDTVVYNAQTSTGQHSFETNGTKRMTIDSSGRVTTPYQPSFRAYLSASVAVNTIITWTGTHHNTGSHFSTSTGRFTAPVTGVYQFNVHNLSDNITAQVNLYIRINGNINNGARTRSASSTGHQTTSVCHSIKLSVGDYVDIFNDGGGIVYGDSTKAWSEFSGHLIG